MKQSRAARHYKRRPGGRFISDGQFATLCLAVLALAVVCSACIALAVHATSSRTVLKEDAAPPIVEINDTPLPRVIPSGRTMPLYLQNDVQWAHIEYAGDSTITESGCGLSCAAMAIEYLTNQITTPRDLQAVVGDTCTVGGVNDMALFGNYAQQTYGLVQSEIYFHLDKALSDVEHGAVVFASLVGLFGDESYGGHIVAIWRVDGDSVFIRDPASGANSQRAFTRSELESVSWSYFYSMTNERA